MSNEQLAISNVQLAISNVQLAVSNEQLVFSMNNKENNNRVPELRFPGFTGEWEEKKLGEVCDRITEKVGAKKLEPISISAGKGFVSQREKFGKDISGEQYKNYIHIHQGDVCYNKGYSKLFPQGSIYELFEFEEVAAPNAFISFRFKPGYLSGFYQGYFDNNEHGRQLVKYITSGARMDGLLNLSAEDFFKISFLVPTLAEQQKIAECLSSLDEEIAAETQKADALKDHKKGLMQQLFPAISNEQLAMSNCVPKLRFSGFTGSWEVKKLGEVANLSKGKGIAKSDIDIHGQTPCIRYGELYTRYGEQIKTVFSRTNIPSQDLVLGKVNDVIIPSSGETHEDIATASCILVPGVAIGGDINILRTPLNGLFLSYYLNSAKKHEIAHIAQGDAVVHLYGTQLSKLSICFPPTLAEQQKIADCLSELDEMISAQQQKVEALKEHKKGLMQKLFPKMSN